MFLLRFTLRLIGLLVALLVILPLVLFSIAIAQKTNNRKLNKTVLNSWSKTLCFICGLKIKTSGQQHANPVFIVANHVSWLDIPVIHSYKLAGFVAKEEISRWPLLGWIVKSGETLFIARGKHESRKKVLALIENRLQAGRSIAVFPEGKATNGESLARFHRQLMHAAIETQTPIQAIAIKYYANDGSRNKQICFMEDEKFISNVFRVLSLPTSTVELNFCETIQTKDKQAKQVAQISHNQVALELAKNDYM
ncbi:Acyl-CoA:1-acyl-sn-glycerol-3-phosphate acyltransferase [hydrothermal vent metagenome]|uniref:Acyl-CoA:1-acyl-sn-glycerol-3-phosphate acyltransferase n=1 Tax=hydrothermal vent metagenome TaxID=652676 RepID=A0A3B0V681_9ZZZZ